MAKCFSKKYGNKGCFQLAANKSYCIKMPISTYATSLPQEQAAKTDMLSVVSLEVFSIVYS